MKKYLFAYKFENLVLMLLLALQSASLVLASVMLSVMTDALVKKDFYGFLFWIGCNLAAYLGYLLLIYVCTVFQTRLIQRMSILIRNDYLQKIQHAPFQSFKQKDQGEHLSILNNDIQIIEQSGFASFYSLLSTVFTTLFSIIALLNFDYRIVVLTIGLTLALTYLPQPFAKKMEQVMGDFSIANEGFVAAMNDQLAGYSTLYYAGRKQVISLQFLKIMRHFMAEKMKFTQKSTAIEVVMALFSIIGQVGVLLLTGLLIALGQISIGAISSVGQIAGNIFNSLTTFNQLRVSMASVRPIFQKFHSESQVQRREFTGNFKQIQLEKVGYQFGDQEVFTNLSLNIERGKKYAIVGQSGSGKSTLLALLLGNLRDYHGKIFYNETDLQTLDENSLLKRINFVSNQTHIFQDTLRNNLTLWDDKITDEQLIYLLEQLNLTDFQNKLSELITENTLSTGQKQRIGLIRALLHPRDILILDEALANLDQQNAQKIEQLFLKQADLTYLTITHHLTPKRAAYFDEVVHLEA